jgi:hypothetical protein
MYRVIVVLDLDKGQKTSLTIPEGLPVLVHTLEVQHPVSDVFTLSPPLSRLGLPLADVLHDALEFSGLSPTPSTVPWFFWPLLGFNRRRHIFL